MQDPSKRPNLHNAARTIIHRLSRARPMRDISLASYALHPCNREDCMNCSRLLSDVMKTSLSPRKVIHMRPICKSLNSIFAVQYAYAWISLSAYQFFFFIFTIESVNLIQRNISCRPVRSRRVSGPITRRCDMSQ